MNWRAIHYGWPEAAVLLFVVLALLGAFIMLFRYRQRKLSSLGDETVLKNILEPRRAIPYWIKSLLFCTAWIFGVLALMDPKGVGHYSGSGFAEKRVHATDQPRIVRQIAQDVVFLIDVSASMGVADTRTGESRLEAAKEIVEEVVSRLKGQNTALFAFTSSTMQIVPLTTDYLFTRLMLRQLSLNEGETEGTDLFQALTKMRQQFFNTPSDKQTSLIILTDGGDTRLESLPGSEKEPYIQKLADLVKHAEGKQLHIDVVGIGSLQGKEIPNIKFQGQPVISKLNEGLLRQLAKSAQGDYIPNQEMTTLQAADQILSEIKSNQQYVEKTVTSPRIKSGADQLIYDLYFQIPLGIGIVALVLALLLPEARPLSLLIGSLLIFPLTEGQCSIPDTQQQITKLFFDAGDYNRAAERYKSLLEEPREEWKRAIITYNLGTSQEMMGGEGLNDSLKTFQSIDLSKLSLPLLNYRLQLNKAIARLLITKLDISKRVENSENILLDYSSISQQLQQAAEDTAQANRSWCELSQAEGAHNCVLPIETQELNLEIKRQYVKVLQKIYNQILTEAPLLNRVMTLLTGTQSAVKHVDFLIKYPLEKDLSIDYLNLFSQRDGSWLPLWESIDKQLLQGNSDKNMQPVFQHAKESFLKSMNLMKQRKFTQSAQSFKDSHQGLNQFAQLVIANNTTQEIVKNIVVQYTLILLNEPLQDSVLASLLVIQTSLEKSVETLGDIFLKELLIKSQESLKKAILSLQHEQPLQAKIYTLDAKHQMKLMSQAFDKKASPSAKEILKQMIEIQEYAFSIYRLRMEIDDKESIDPHLDRLMQEAQNQTFQSSDTFYQAVIKAQNVETKGETIPWEEVIPLFTEGLQSAQEAEKWVASSKGGDKNILRLQEKTLSAWKDALAHMQKKKKSDIKQKEEEKSQELSSKDDQGPKSQQDQPKSSSAEQQNSSLNDLLRSLQEMENDDKSRPHFNPPANKEMERPW